MPILGNFPTGTGSGGGGGLAVGAVSGIATLVASGKVYVKFTDPSDLIVDGTTLATWAGTLLVRKAGSMPTTRRDGTVVLDNKTRGAYTSTYFCDSGLTDGTKYYYKFFPYTTQNVYTDLTADEFEATPNPVAPGNVSGMAVAAAGNGKLGIKWTDPAATVVSDGITLATWASTKVVVKAGSYATDPDDADAAFTFNSTTRNAYASTQLVATGLTNGTTYYVSFFPISTDGGVNTNASNRISGVANRMTISAVPAQTGTLTYNGNSQTPTWNSAYDSTKMDKSEVGQTNAGTYTTTSFTPKSDYMWSDGSTTAKTPSWTINRATPSKPTTSKSSIILNSSTPSDTFTVTRDGNGTVQATSSDTSIATVSVSGTTVTVNNIAQTSGTATITIKVAQGTNYNAYTATDVTVGVTAQFLPVKKTLNNQTWAEIRQVSDAGKGSEYWAVGDAKQITINGTVGLTSISNFTVWAFVLGFDHNSGKEGTNRIHFQLGRTAETKTDTNGICFVDSTYGNYNANNGSFTMNPASNSSGSKNAGGWNASHMRKTLLGSDGSPTSPASNTFLAALPSDLRAVMKTVTKYSDNTGGGSDTASYVTATTDVLFLLSEFEVQGARSYANSAEQNYQAQYQYYKDGNSKVRYKHNATTTTAHWWLRSVYASGTTYFCRVSTDGSATHNRSGYCRGVAPAFCV